MIQICICTDAAELKLFQNLESDLSGNSMWQSCDLYTTQAIEKWIQWIKEKYPVDILVCDVTKQGAITALKRARETHTNALIIPIADQTVMPSDYVRPDILPFTLLWKPLTSAGIKETMLHVLYYIHEEEEMRAEKSFELITKQETRYIPFRDIIYFEARDKKIFLRLRHQEICFYATLGKLENQLPAEFVRCHKSYIINSLHIGRIERSEQMIYLDDKIAVPLSRTYRNRFKGDLYGNEII